MSHGLEIGQHWVKQINIEHLGAFQVHMDTLIMSWLAMFIVITVAFLMTRKLKRIPSKLQVLGEMIFDFIKGIADDQIGKDGKNHIPVIGSLFLFILSANLVGQLPWKLYHLPEGELASPTNDVNLTVALALIVVLYYMASGIKKKGWRYFEHYLQPIWFMAPFNLLEDFTRPLSLSVRLFANILAGEVIIMVLIGMLPLFLPIPIMLFELFVAFIQAFIFAVLAASYIATVSADGH
jgi:F-type H+-transporting ATPase subunit a